MNTAASARVDELISLTATQAAKLIRQKDLSPVELLQAVQQVVERRNGTLNAIVGLDWEAAFNQARAAEQSVMAGESLGLLHGLPTVIKDLNDVAGFRSTFGSLMHKDRIADADDCVVEAIRASGAVIFGKSNTPEFGSGAITDNLVYGSSANPYNSELTTGGSSGGAAAALSSRMTKIANGSDFGGSLRIPAAFCGVVGLRPSPGVVRFDKRDLLWSPWTVEGPMGIDVSDCALLFETMRKGNGADPFQKQLSVTRGVALGDLTIALSADLDGSAPVSSAISDKFWEVAHVVGQWFGDVREACPNMGRANDAYGILRGFEYVANHAEKLRKNKDLLGENVIWNTEQGLKLGVEEVAWASKEVGRLFLAFDQFFETTDVLMLPTTSVLPFPNGNGPPERVGGRDLENYYSWFALTYLTTLAGHPVLSLPLGMIGDLPFGVQLVGKFGADLELLEIARRIERLETRIKLMEDVGYWTIRIHDTDIENLDLPYTLDLNQGRIFWYDARVDGITNAAGP